MSDHHTNPIHPSESIPPAPLDAPTPLPPTSSPASRASNLVNSALQRPLHIGMSTRTNATLDFVVAFVLILAPWFLSYSDHAVTPVSRTFAAMLLFYSLCTKYEFGILRMIPLQVHLLLDLGMALLLAASPIHFGIWGLSGLLFVVLGITMGVSALFTHHSHKFTRPGLVRSETDASIRPPQP
jgi:hypothetical protein